MVDKRTGRFGQTKIYTKKFFRIFWNEKGWKLFVFAAVAAFIIAMVLGDSFFVIKERTRNDFFAIVCAGLWIGIFNSIQTVCKERDIIKHEHRTGLHITSYVAAHIVFQFVICVIQALIMTVIYAVIAEFPKAGLVTGSFVVDFYITILLVVFASDMLGLAVSSLVKTTTMAMTVMPFVLIVQLVFSGTIFSLSGNAKIISDLTICKWGQRALCIEANMNELQSEMLDVEMSIIKSEPHIQELMTYLEPEDVEKFDNAIQDKMEGLIKDYTSRKIYTYDANLVLQRWGYLLIFSAVYGAICVISLEFVDRDKR